MPVAAPKPKLSVEAARVFVPALRHKGRYLGLSGGRGSGKSHFVGEKLIVEPLTTHIRCVCAREVQNSIAESSKQLLEDKIYLTSRRIKDELLRRKFLASWRITDTELVYKPTDSLFIFRGMLKHTVASIKSLEGYNRFWGEEAQTFSQKSVDLATPTFRVPGSQLVFSWNPVSPKDPVDRFFRENKDDPDFLHITANYYDNPWFPDDLRRDMERDKRREFDKYLHVWRGAYQTMSEARVFKNWTIKPFRTPRNAQFYQGADWGYSVDPAVLVRCFMGRWGTDGSAVYDPLGDTLFIDYECHQVGCEIDNTPALFDTLVPEEPQVARRWPLIADSARPETISYMRRHGYPRIRPSVKGAGSVEDGIEFVKSFDIVVNPRCVHLIDELSTYSWKIDPKTGEILPILEDKNNHVIDALRYAVESVRRSGYTLRNVG